MRVPIAAMALTAAGVMAMAPLAPAQAATGYVVINDTRYDDPSGCYPLNHLDRAFVVNHTGERAYIYHDPACTRRFLAEVVPPGDTEVFWGAGSLRID
ncbi:hypothetical protein ABGB18_09235 [Nonomuraea sp. B12E4]|uniref:hypothetical protein n=1 Tax=Nonomuraea sp. B12E4 TaxID=3153564 RepID=UPI00325DA283